MCTTIIEKLPLNGVCKGPDGWFATSHAYVAYDHPSRAPLEHALSIRLVAEEGSADTLVVELSREEGRRLLESLSRALQQADLVEG